MNRHYFYITALLAVLVLAMPLASYAAQSGAAHLRLPTVADTPTTPVGQKKPGDTVARTVRVGLLLPLTGRNATIGVALQDSATVALFDYYARLSNEAITRVELLPRDTGDTPQQTSAALSSVLDEGVELIIGPLFSEDAAALTATASKKNVSMISFSNNTVQARPGLYMFGFSPQEQAKRVVTYAFKQGKSRIAALVPESALGKSVAEAANAALDAQGAQLVAVAFYPPQGVGLDKALSTLMPDGKPNFDALLLPEGGPALGTILRALEARGAKLPKVQLLGTGIWDDATLIRRVNLEGAWLASSPPASTGLFEQRFVANYGYQPPRIASLAYDAVSLAGTLATSERGFTRAALTNQAGFNGPANGNFRLHPDGTVERALAVLQIRGAGFTVIDLAPKSFIAAGAGQ